MELSVGDVGCRSHREQDGWEEPGWDGAALGDIWDEDPG